jgi:NAD(P)-dependent dehydrogenase (short-subunit alcohol dehydrogenase family)
MGARSERRAYAAIERLHADNPSLPKGTVIYLPLDLSDLDDVVKAAELFLQKETRLDILGGFQITQ